MILTRSRRVRKREVLKPTPINIIIRHILEVFLFSLSFTLKTIQINFINRFL